MFKGYLNAPSHQILQLDQFSIKGFSFYSIILIFNHNPYLYINTIIRNLQLKAISGYLDFFSKMLSFIILCPYSTYRKDSIRKKILTLQLIEYILDIKKISVKLLSQSYIKPIKHRNETPTSLIFKSYDKYKIATICKRFLYI